MTINKEKLVDMYTKLVTIRRYEERIDELCRKGDAPGTLHPAIGQEAVAVGVCANLRPDDRLTSNHRSSRAHIIAKGGDIKRIAAEQFGRKTGYCSGRAGEVHLADFSIGDMGSNGIVGGGLPIATGSGLASKLQGTDQVTVCFFGDGAACQGAFQESLNLASIWKLPVIYVCENNLYAIQTPTSFSISAKNIADRASGYSMPGIVVDGQDIMAVYDATAQAVERARSGEGPSLLECKTYRFTDHQGGRRFTPNDPRPGEEVEKWKRRDPITIFEAKLIKMGMLTKADITKIDSEVKAEIDEAISFAQQSPWPAPEEALENLYA